jgi:stage II sporulation protein D
MRVIKIGKSFVPEIDCRGRRRLAIEHLKWSICHRLGSLSEQTKLRVMALTFTRQIGTGLQVAILANVVLLMLLLVCQSQPVFSATRHDICVHLFSSRPAPEKIQVLSPVMAKLGGTEFLTDGTWEIRADHALIRARSGRYKRTIEGPSLSLRSTAANRIALRVDGSIERMYRGTIRIVPAGKSTLRAQNYVPVRDYIASVVGSEAPPGSPIEMLKAQAILSQTLLARLDEEAVIEDSTQAQVYGGASSERPEVRGAVADVAGKILTYDGRPATIFFHSTCAGKTSTASEYFALKSGSLPYLKSVPCKFCKDSPFWKETCKTVPLTEWKKVFGEPLPVVSDRDGADRPITVVVGETRRETGYAFWLNVGQRLGWDKLPGTRFNLSRSGDVVELKSNGAGHGVGLCQWGAIGLARQGRNYQQIIDYYYRGCKIR